MTFGDILLKNFGGSCCKSINGLVLITIGDWRLGIRDCQLIIRDILLLVNYVNTTT